MDSCCTNPGAKQTHESQGHEEEVAGINTYKIGQGKAAIVLFSDVFGYAFPNIRKIADRFAATIGATVLIPDCFQEDPLDIKNPNYRDLLPDWLAKHPTTDGCALGDKFLSAIKGHYDSIQIMGFCYGAKIVVYLIGHSELSSTVKAGIVAHPAFLVEEEAGQIKRPILFLCAENDFTFSPEMKEHYEKELTANGLGKFITHPGTVHGFTTRPDGTELSNQGSENAIEAAIEYFQKNI